MQGLKNGGCIVSARRTPTQSRIKLSLLSTNSGCIISLRRYIRVQILIPLIFLLRQMISTIIWTISSTERSLKRGLATWDVNRQRPFVGFCRFLSVGFVGFWTYRNLQIYFSEPTILSVFVGFCRFFCRFWDHILWFSLEFFEKNSHRTCCISVKWLLLH